MAVRNLEKKGLHLVY